MKYSNMKVWSNSIAVAILVAFSLPVLAASSSAETKSEDAKQNLASYARGAQAWANNCSRCHNARDPKDYRDDQWPVIMQHMRIRAGLTGQETRDILKFMQGSN